MSKYLCLQCRQRPKSSDHTFCSPECGRAAANYAPNLLWIPPGHVQFENVAQHWNNGWKKRPAPAIRAMYLVTWDKKTRDDLEKYRREVETQTNYREKGRFEGNEQKRFWGVDRACGIGENGVTAMCFKAQCWLCPALRNGFREYLTEKRNTGLHGTRLGYGIYTTRTSSKAARHAVNVGSASNSNVHAMVMCRVVIGNSYSTKTEQPFWHSPPAGYHSVLGEPGPDSSFRDDELVVYTERAIRPAYLILY
ncbi:hypothetical protein ED733_002423 [Metarhizium rileyi]|uniref:PARP catalytic domain-containing protein n=1 Tax=Metarhizium rileyi (strain RCEF 4871) TaxID=1649241 RepID=A0A5C6G950_METRR|nr:hypothetical protein ED733_002423 [Metarhizium rileyi]